MDDWALVAELCYMFDLDSAGLVKEAHIRAVSPRDIIAGFTRTFAYMRIHGIEGSANAPLTELDALPPGTLDKRIVFNDAIWIDTFRTSHTISTMPGEYVSAVIAFLQARAPDWYDLGPEGGDIQAWLETTPLMLALRHRLEALDEAD
ncbi:hypothetical protein [Leifsonia sp. 2MCAF36]|uniref:hypothetical protein n=1 Tax=Leifsonia sp. 2MCAF36 TaxID=3232988 RepID=UPI003F9B5F13